ncbi:MAG: hypothetical protein HC895_17005 [Leptolyngbyaceae cyanobacterium SM1_3_5]|nr:hypothetical protein [Leptolyngbyaceae cyanobacterium SM1_3_5]
MPPKTARFFSLACLSVTAALALSAPARSQSLSVPDEELQPEQSDLRPLTQDGSLLSMQGGQRLMNEASAAVNAQNYDLAVSKLQDARQVYNQLSNFYQQLAASFSGIDTRITERQREQALQAAQMRDQATYQLALVHRAQNRPELAVPLLVQIIRSQQPTRDLGQQAYRQLYELGFVDSPFPRDSGSTSSAPAPATSATPIQSVQPLN